MVKAKSWKDMPEGKEKYGLYLASREWSVLKEAVKKRSGGVCERCRNYLSDAVHHLTYIRKYNERLEDLQDICNSCHNFTHGKSNFDPAGKKQLRFLGAEINSLYLAGKISGPTRWRDEIVPEWSTGKFSGYGEKSWPDLDLWLQPGDYKPLKFNGPWWLAEDPKHGIECTCEPHNDSSIPSNAVHAIKASDLVFAWIDSTDCFGTLWELGYASAINKHTAIAFRSDLDCREMWFIAQQCDWLHFGKSASECWKALLAGKPSMCFE